MLKNKKILIIGGTTGIGLAAGKAFVKQGAQVWATGLSCETRNSKSWKYKLSDATKEESALLAIENCVAAYGGVDALFHVAGGSGRKWGDAALHELTTEGWEKTMDLNLKSVMLSNRAILRYFLENHQKGAILNTSTVLAYKPSPKYFYTHAYAASKAAIIGLSKSAAAYYAPKNIRINVIAPALTLTPMAVRAAQRADIQHFIKTKQPLDGGRMANPSDLNAAATYLLSDAAGFVTGQVLAVDGGWSVSEGQY